MEISVTKDAVKFGTNGDIGSANVMCRHAAVGGGRQVPLPGGRLWCMSLS